MDQTLDNQPVQKAAEILIPTAAPHEMVESTPIAVEQAVSNAQVPENEQAEFSEQLNPTNTPRNNSSNDQTELKQATDESTGTRWLPMSELDIARYAGLVSVRYPTNNGMELYKIAEIIPLTLRTAFEAGLGGSRDLYRAEVERRGTEPLEQPIPDILAVYLSLGFVSTEALYQAYKHACEMGHKMPFLTALSSRNPKAIEHLKAMVAGKRYHVNMVIASLPKFGLDGKPRVPASTALPVDPNFANDSLKGKSL